MCLLQREKYSRHYFDSPPLKFLLNYFLLFEHLNSLIGQLTMDSHPSARLGQVRLTLWWFCPRSKLKAAEFFFLHYITHSIEKNQFVQAFTGKCFLGQKSPWTIACLDTYVNGKKCLRQLSPWTIIAWKIVVTWGCCNNCPRDQCPRSYLSKVILSKM